MDTWAAARALLQYHARLLDGPNAPTALRYRIPPTAPVLYELIDALQPIFPPTPKRQKPLKERNLLNKPFCLEFFLRGHTGAREGEGLWELDVGTVQ